MKISETTIKDLLVLEPHIFKDKRGYFFESYNVNEFKKYGLNIDFLQDNQSRSDYGVIRGLHMQTGEFAQTKLVRVLEGRVYDVAVDLRPNSLTYRKWYGIELSVENQFQLLIPKGFCHGFSVLSDTAVIFYKCDTFYNKDSEYGIKYNDPSLNIDWRIPKKDIIVSPKDENLPFLSEE